MSKIIFTSKGTPVVLGRELGKGGEGSVHEVPALANQVAKLYHATPETKKQDKLRFMAATADSELLAYVAWPQETLHPAPGGPVIGFLMPKIGGKDPIHMIYSPAHRRQTYPHSAWDFLLYVARNVAASFESVHAHGHVIGDVNQNSVMVGSDSKVVLIDSDSFQIQTQGVIHRCEVGVSHFTPPELQSLSSFHGVTRTTNHDNFGLALLIFHVLFGGRHPYSGVPMASGVGEALETDIKHFRYAYARDNHLRGIKPPPRSIPISMLPNTMEAMFQLAFTEGGVTARPMAREWVRALDDLRQQLQKCSSTNMHIFPRHLAKCPWCTLEQQGVVYFIDLGGTITPTANGFVLSHVWGLIQAVPPPAALIIPSPKDFAVAGQSLPPDLAKGKNTIIKIIAVTTALLISAAAKDAWLWGMIAGIIIWGMASYSNNPERNAEIARRRQAHMAAKQDYDQLVEQTKREASPDGFHARMAEYIRLKDVLETLSKQEQQEIDKLQSTARERQLKMFLNGCFIEDATIPGVGPTRKAILRSFGIETANDVSLMQIMQVRGFGPSLTSAMQDWKAGCERRFKFDPAKAVSPSERDAVRTRFAIKRATLERRLSGAPEDLRQYNQNAALLLISRRPQLEAAARRLAVAEANLAII